MKTRILLILLSFVFASCNPFITKELRRKNKCNRKLERVVSKCPELLHTDTISVPFEVIVPKIEIKDSLFVDVDTFELLKYVPIDKIRTVIESISKDTLIVNELYTLRIMLSNGVLHHDIQIRERKVKGKQKAAVKVIQPIKLEWYEEVLNWLGGVWKWLIIPLIIFLIVIWLIRQGKRFI